jgi:hypothetical protein
MLWRPHDRHRNIQMWTRSARLFARRNQDRHVMIQIASPATPQPSSLLAPRRRRSPNDAPGAFREHGRREKYDPIAARERSLATLYPSKSCSTTDASDSQIPIGRAAATPFRLALPWRFSNAGPVSADSNGQSRAGIRKPSQKRTPALRRSQVYSAVADAAGSELVTTAVQPVSSNHGDSASGSNQLASAGDCRYGGSPDLGVPLCLIAYF